MDPRKRERLATQGWVETTVQEFLDLSDDEVAYIELKLYLGKLLREQRKQMNLTQEELAKELKSSQSRVAKMEKGDPSVSLDLQVKALLRTGISSRELGAELHKQPEKVTG